MIQYLILTEACFGRRVLIPAARMVVHEFEREAEGHYARAPMCDVTILGGGDPIPVAQSFDEICALLRRIR